MLHRYRDVIARLPAVDALCAAAALKIPPVCSTNLYPALERAGLGQADLVLALLRAGRHSSVEMLIGKPITVLPPQASPVRNLPLPRRERGPDEGRIVIRARENPLKIPTARARFETLRRCRTVASYLAHYPTWRARRDLREWSAAGWVEVAA